MLLSSRTFNQIGGWLIFCLNFVGTWFILFCEGEHILPLLDGSINECICQIALGTFKDTDQMLGEHLGNFVELWSLFKLQKFDEYFSRSFRNTLKPVTVSFTYLKRNVRTNREVSWASLPANLCPLPFQRLTMIFRSRHGS